MSRWKVISDAKFYRAPISPKHWPKAYANLVLDKGLSVDGDIVYLRYNNKFTPWLKLNKGATGMHKYITLSNVTKEGVESSFSGNIEEHILAHLDDSYSNVFGDGFKEFIDKIQGKNISKEEADALSDKNKVEYTEEEARTLHENSGSKSSFGDWLKGGGATRLLSSVDTLGSQVLINRKGTKIGASTDDTTSDDKGSDKTILGMHPITFAITGIGVIAGIALIAYISKRRTKSV